MPNQRILIIEDEENLAEALRYTFDKEGYEVQVVHNGKVGLEVARASRPDLVILDFMLPDLDGLAICKALRREGDMPILMLTARGSEEDQVAGLDAGADDYVTKPFGMRELLARVRAMLRRQGPPADSTVLDCGDLRINLAAHTASMAGRELELTRREFNLLRLFAQNRGKAFTRENILQELWGTDWVGDVRTVDVHVRWLREKIEENASLPRMLITIRGLGYRFDG